MHGPLEDPQENTNVIKEQDSLIVQFYIRNVKRGNHLTGLVWDGGV